MRRSTFRGAGFATALALGAALLAAPTPGAAAAFCQTVASTVTKADIDVDDNPGAQFSCHTSSSSLNVAQFPGSSGASTEVTPGVLRTRTSATSSDSIGEGSFLGAQAIVDFRDTITVDGLGPAGALLTFKIGLDGLLSANAGVGDTASSTFTFTGDLGNRNRPTGERRVFQACVRNSAPGISTCNGAFDADGLDNVPVHALVSLSVFAFNGDVIDIILAQQTRSFTNIATPNGAASSEALFLNTTDWRGLDFTDDNRNVTFTSQSGFDYRYAALPQAVPEPTSWALMILGFSATGAVIRRRRSAPAAA